MVLTYLIDISKPPFSLDSGKNYVIPDTRSRNTPPELTTRKTTVEIPQNIKFYLAKDKTSPRLGFKYATITNPDNTQIKNLEHFQLYLECLNYHYEVYLLGKSTFKPIPMPWKNNTIKTHKRKLHRKNLILLIEKENLIDNVNLILIQKIQSKESPTCNNP